MACLRCLQAIGAEGLGLVHLPRQSTSRGWSGELGRLHCFARCFDPLHDILQLVGMRLIKAVLVVGVDGSV
jgi:hypothetical protein